MIRRLSRIVLPALLATPALAQFPGADPEPTPFEPAAEHPQAEVDALAAADAPQAAQELASSLQVRELLTRPLVDVDAEGRLWTRGRDHRASFGPEGFTYLPVFGRRSSQEWPVRMTCAEATLGGQPLDVRGIAPAALETETTVVLTRAELEEVYHLGLDGVEQTFRFQQLPGEGDLVLRVQVDTELLVEAAGERLAFVHPELGEVRYGSAEAYDAAGRRTPVERHWDGGAIELTVPAAFLASAALPLTVDPLVSTFVNGFGVDDDADPDIVFCGVSNEYMICWEEYTSAINSDVYVTKFAYDLSSQNGVIGVEIGSDMWTDPRIAYSYAADRALVVASVNPDGIPNATSSVRGRLVDVSALALPGAEIQISTAGAPKTGVDVGGSAYNVTSYSHFCVVWSWETAPGNGDVQYRLLESDGTFATGIETVDASVENDVTPVISDSLGNTAANGDWWTMAWIRDDGTDGRGQVWARRVVWSGDPAFGAGNFLVDSSYWNANPSVTAQFDEALPGGAQRPSVIASDRLYADADHPSGARTAIVAHVVTDGTPGPLQRLTSSQADLWKPQNRSHPVVATDGTSLFVVYREEKWSSLGSLDFDIAFQSGAVRMLDGQPEIALAERHVLLSDDVTTELAPRIATRANGELLPNGADDAVATWYRLAGISSFGELRGARVISDASNGLGRPVGVQYCDANPNSRPELGGQTTSWMSLLGTGNLANLHLAVCQDLPANVFGYLMASRSSGDMNLVGGSMGRLCLAGSIGRYTNAIGHSGPTGTFSTVVDPSALPTSLGPVAALPGESWYFQFWHRDSVNGQSTSNFTNAVEVQFVP